MTVGTFLGGRVVTEGDFAVVDEELLLSDLVERCRQRCALLAERSTLLNLSWVADRHVKVQTTNDTYLTRLVIDATGGLSPIAQTFRLHKLKGFYAVYGARLQNIHLLTPDIVLAYVGHLGNPPPILEVIPCGADSAYCAVFIYSRTVVPPHTLDSMFRAYCHHNPFFAMRPTTEIVSPKLGSIAIGSLRRRWLPRVLPIGEAAMVQPPLLGTAFNEVLEYSEAICSHVDCFLEKDANSRRFVAYRYPLLKQTQDRVQLMLSELLLRENTEAFDRLVRFMNALPSDVVFKLYSNELNWMQLLSVAGRLVVHALFTSRSVATSDPELP
jgi:2-polyprenyl-6-methoxyphenol hydroxylase-like FAD-dependent oxidoreductase